MAAKIQSGRGQLENSGWHQLCCHAPFYPRSVVIPDKRATFERLESIATIQKRLQDLLDEGRLLRRSIEVASVDLELPIPSDPELPGARRRRSKIKGRSKLKAKIKDRLKIKE